MGDHTQFNILCAYCDKDATEQVIMDIGTRYLCAEHLKYYTPYWPVRKIDQRTNGNKLPCGVWYSDTKQGEVEKSYLRNEKDRVPFHRPIIVSAETADYLMRLIDASEDQEKREEVYEQLSQAYSHLDRLDRINNCGRYQKEGKQ